LPLEVTAAAKKSLAPGEAQANLPSKAPITRIRGNARRSSATILGGEWGRNAVCLKLERSYATDHGAFVTNAQADASLRFPDPLSLS